MAELNTLINRPRDRFSSRIGTERNQCVFLQLAPLRINRIVNSFEAAPLSSQEA